MRLYDFQSKGGRVLDADDDSEVDLAASFGSLFCAPDPVPSDATGE